MDVQSDVLGGKPDTALKPNFEPRPLAALNLRHGATVSQVVEHLREDILEGRIPPGTRLVEAHLTDRFAVSRGPVREAFRRLQAEGLIELPQNRGAFVKRLTARDIAELFEIRAELEALAARRAAGRAKRNSRARGRFAFLTSSRALEAGSTPTDYLEENERFHAAVIELAGNGNLEAICRRIQLPFAVSQIHLSMSQDELRAGTLDHVAIAQAIVAGDEDLAATAMRDHIHKTAAIALSHAEDAGIS